MYILAECCKMQGNSKKRETHQVECLDFHVKMLGRGHRLTIDPMEANAECLVWSGQYQKAELLYAEIVTPEGISSWIC
jgi:hypothetical protein